MKSIRAYLFLFAFVGLSAISGCDADTANHLPGVDPWMDGNPVDFAEFAANADKGPVVMINLLKFRDKSLDGDGTGAEAYARYGQLAGPFVERHGGKLLWAGEAKEHLVGDTNYDWDSVLLVEPSSISPPESTPRPTSFLC